MTRWMLTIDGIPAAYYDDEWEANRDAQHLRHVFGDRYTVDIEVMELSWK